MLYLAIPAHNEAATIGVLLWRLRTVLAEFPREYEAVVYDDASDDSTSEILESYARVMPLTVLRGERKVGYAGAVDALVRHVSRHTRYPRRDAMLLLQGDFTDSPSLVPEFVKRFEGGTDFVVGERGNAVRRKAPTPVRRLMRAEPWLLRFFVKAEGIRDLTSSYRLVRISVLRDLLRTVGDAAVCVGDPRTANADFLMRVVPLARRVEALPVEPTWDVRLRETRVDAIADGMNLLKWAWRSRGKKAVPSTAPDAINDAPRQGRTGRDGRADLRLDGRSDSAGDVVITVAESGRGSSRDTAGNRTRKSRSARSEGRNDNREDKRSEGRTDERPDSRNTDQRKTDSRNAEPRAENRPIGRNDAKNAGRTEARSEPRRDPQLQVVSNATDEALISTDSEESTELVARERPPRRKRSRGGRRDRVTNTGTEGGEDIGSSTPVLESASGAPERDFDRDDLSDPPRVDIELSPALSEAVADAEAQLDLPGHSRPARKKRRRRGGRGGRAAGAIAGGDDASASGDGEDGGEAERDFVSRSSEGAGESSEAEPTSAESGDQSGAEGEERVRRRGRRGRRGGSRRSRAARGDTSGDFSGGSDSSDGGGEPSPSSPAED